MKSSKWCIECETWTKKYDENGIHICGNEVYYVGTLLLDPDDEDDEN